MSAEDDLALLAHRVRELYWAARCNHELAATGMPVHTKPVAAARWDGGTDSGGRRHQPIWPKIALHLFAAGVDPETAVRAIFVLRAGTTSPFPNALLRPDIVELSAERAEKDYRHALAHVEAERVAIKSRLARLARATSLPDRMIYRKIILAGDMALSPLMRLCLARQTSQHDLEEDLEEEAFLQYCACPAAYDEALGAYVPGDFPQRREGLRALAQRGH
jgi:hypothetical protein